MEVMILPMFLTILPWFAHAGPDFASLRNGTAQITSSLKFTGVPMGRNAFNYYGIRYGKANRFEHSVANIDFAYISNPSHPKQGYICPQIIRTTSGLPKRNLTASEDCLYLDVYVPPISERQTEKFPVLFWIHGGGYYIGDKDLYNATLLAADIEVVVVTMNYRLGAFGSLRLAKGNWGIGDMRLALNWTHQNIEAFGGDPEKITISGQSSGGVSVSILMSDDAIRGIVQAAVSMSGSNLLPYVDKTDLAPSMVRLEAASHGCPTQPMSEAINCLKRLPFEEFIKPKGEMIGTLVSPQAETPDFAPGVNCSVLRDMQ